MNWSKVLKQRPKTKVQTVYVSMIFNKRIIVFNEKKKHGLEDDCGCYILYKKKSVLKHAF